ncbi:MAG: PAS domain S-box protein [Methylococcales bacterium]
MIKQINKQAFFLYSDAQSPLFRYGLAALTVVIVAVVTAYVPVLGERAAFFLFFFAIIQASFWLGRYAGLFALILSLVMVNALVLFPVWISETYTVFVLNVGFILLAAVIIDTSSFSRKMALELWVSKRDLDQAQAIGLTGSWRMNLLRNELRWSDENYRIFGIPKGTPLTYETFLATVHPEDREAVDQKWQAALSGAPYDIEHRIVVADKVKWVRERAILEFNNEGVLLGGFGNTLDITDLRQSELESLKNRLRLLETHRHFAGIVESAMDAIITIDINHRILVFNPAAENMFGCSAKEAIGGSLDRFIPERFRKAHAKHTHAFGRSGVTSRKIGFLGAITGLRANGEEFPLEVSISQAEIGGEKSFTAIMRDITERQRAESVLKEQFRLQDQLARVAAMVPGVICSFRLRPDGKSSMPYASPVFEAVTGLSRGVVAEDFSPFFARIHPDDIKHVNETTAESARNLHPWRGEFRYNHPTKGEIWIESHSMPQQEEGGSILWHGYIQDVTGRKQVEAELKERSERYELVLEGAQDAIWDWDVPNKRIHYSTRWKALRGFAEHEIGDSEAGWSLGIHPDDAVRVFAAVKAHFEGKTPFFCEEYRIHCKDGSWKWILDRGLVQKDTSGEVIRMAGSENDITERKRAEMALRDRESELSLIMDATPALMSYLDVNLRYLRVNATYENWFGISAGQILGQSVRSIIGETSWAIVQPYFEKALTGERVSFDQIIPYGDAKPRWVNATYIPHKDSAGTVKGVVVHVVDIDDRKQAEQEIVVLNQNLHNSLEQMQVIFDTVPVGLAIAHDATGQHIYGNPLHERLLGLPPGSELSKRTLSPAPYQVMQEGRELAVEALPMQRAIRGEKVINQVLDILRPDGQVVTLLANATPLLNEAGDPRGAVGAFQDITEEKKAAEVVRLSEAFVRGVLNSLPEHVVVLDKQGVVTAVNEPWERFASENNGAPSCVSVGANYLEVCSRSTAAGDQYAREALAGLQTLLAGQQEEFAMEYPCPTPSRELWFLMYAKRMQQGSEGVILTHLNITERKHAEAELHETQTRLALVVEEVQAGYWDWDLLTNLLYLSPEWKRQLGLNEKESLIHWDQKQDRLHPDDRVLVMAASENFIAGRLPSYELEFRLRHKNGSYRWIHSRAALLRDQENRPTRMLGINLDVTDYMQIRELNQRRDKMEQAFRLYVASQTAAAIAHELNQPLTAISYYADVAQELLKTGNPKPQKLSEVMDKCSQQALRAGGVIRQLLTILHKGETLSEPVDINSAITEACNYVRADGHLGAFKIELDLAGHLSPVMANNLQIQKVLINLLYNGLESMQDSGRNAGTITVTSHGAADERAMVQVTVRDCGKGVADSVTLKTMFQPFNTTKATGLGMGLAISRALVEAHGGKMWAEQNAGSGISIHFTLPFAI